MAHEASGVAERQWRGQRVRRIALVLAVTLLAALVAACDPANYAVDATFGSSGVVAVPGWTGTWITRHELVLGPGKAALVASWVNGHPGVVKINRDGNVDTAFAARVPTNLQTIVAMAIDGSGRILLEQATGQVVVVTRLTADGSVDSSFGTAGSVTLAHPALGNFDLAVDHAGRIDIMFDVPVTGHPDNACAVQRLTPNGGTDASFHGGAPVVLPFVHPDGSGQDVVCPRLLVRSDDGISVVETLSGVITLTPTGAVDSKVANGAAAFVARGQITDATLLPGDVVVLGGTSYDSPSGYRMTVGRLLANGQLDTGFASGGIDAVGYVDLRPECTSGPGNDDRLSWLAATPAGNLVAVGYDCAGVTVARWTRTGRDTTFGSGGRLLLHKNAQADPSSYNSPQTGGVAPDGSLVTGIGIGQLTWLVGASRP